MSPASKCNFGGSIATSPDNESICGEDNPDDVRRRSLVVAMIAFELALFLLTVSLGVT